MSAAAGQRIAQMTMQTLQPLQNDETFHLFLEKCLLANSLEVDEPQLPCHCKRPNRCEKGTSAVRFPSSPKDLYHQQYFEVIDLVTACVKD